jgi:hypothetical protein
MGARPHRWDPHDWKHLGSHFDTWFSNVLCRAFHLGITRTPRNRYGGFLRRVVRDDCAKQPDGRCLLDKGLDMVEQSFVPYDWVRGTHTCVGISTPILPVMPVCRPPPLQVLLGRPDTVWTSVRGAALVLDMVAIPDRLTFPFPCSEPETTAWGCAADTFVAVPGSRLAAFRQSCVGCVRGTREWFLRQE